MARASGDAGAVASNAGAGVALGLRHGTLSQIESLGQSVANIAPSLTPALNITVVAGLAGLGSWVAYLFATIALLFVAGGIASLARRHPLSGSYFVYVGRTFGPLWGALSGWAMVEAYLLTSVAALVSTTIFVQNLLAAVGLPALAPPAWLTCVVFGALIWFAGYREIKISARLGLLLEAVSVALIVLVLALVVVRRGSLFDPAQFDVAPLRCGGSAAARPFAGFRGGGCARAATLAKETRDPGRTIPRAITGSAAAVGLFFTLAAYCMVMGMNDDTATIGNSSSPMTDLAVHGGIGWAAAIIYFSATVSAFACTLACITAASRLLFSMARYGVVGRRLDAVHRTHQTPHVAVGVCCAMMLVLAVAVLPLGALDAFGYTGTLATFGFLLVYLLISIAAPIDLRGVGAMRASHIAVGAIGALLMAFVIFGSLYPVPPWPYGLLPYLFALYMLGGGAWFLWLRRREPARLAMIEQDLEA